MFLFGSVVCLFSLDKAKRNSTFFLNNLFKLVLKIMFTPETENLLFRSEVVEFVDLTATP